MFKPAFIEGTTLDDTWFQLLERTFSIGREYTKTSGSRQGMKMRKLDFVSCFIHDPHTRPLAPIMPQGQAPITTDENIEKYFTNYLMDSNLDKNEHYKYSVWINGSNISSVKNYRDNAYSCYTDQLSFIIRHFKEAGYGNEHCYLHIGNPTTNRIYDVYYMYCNNCKEYFPNHVKLQDRCPACGGNLIVDELTRPTTPCLRGLDFGIIDKYLMIHAYFRSNDAFAWPENMGGLTLLNEFVAEQLPGIEPGPMAYSSKSFHCPEDMYSILKLRLNK